MKKYIFVGMLGVLLGAGFNVQAAQTTTTNMPVIPPPKVSITANGHSGWIGSEASDNSFTMTVGTKNQEQATSFKSNFKPITIVWSSTNTTDCMVDGTSITGTAGHYVVNELKGDKTITATCHGKDGTSKSESVQLLAVRLEMKANGERPQTSAVDGSVAKITWTSTHAKSCSVFAKQGKEGAFDYNVHGYDFRLQGSCVYCSYANACYSNIYDSVLLKSIPKTKNASGK